MTVFIRKAGLIFAGLLVLLIRGRLNAENADMQKSVNLSNFVAAIQEPARRAAELYRYNPQSGCYVLAII